MNASLMELTVRVNWFIRWCSLIWLMLKRPFLLHRVRRPTLLNSIRDLEPLFDAFARQLAPPGWLFLSILNPIHWSQLVVHRSQLMRLGWWCNVLWEHRVPAFCIPEPSTAYLHLVPALLRAAPQFHLVGRANAGTFVRYDPVLPKKAQTLWWGPVGSRRKSVRRLWWRIGTRKLLGHFVFLVLRRNPDYSV